MRRTSAATSPGPAHLPVAANGAGSSVPIRSSVADLRPASDSSSASSALELRGKDPLLRLGVGERRHDPVEVGGDVGRRGRTLEHGRERGAGTPAFVHERELAVHTLAQLLEPADDRHELVGPRRPELALDRRQTAV